MSQRPSTKTPATSTANILKRGGVYHLLMLVDGRWLETGITSRKFLEITQIADREFKVVHVNAPIDVPPPLPPTATSTATATATATTPTPAKQDGSREGASDKAKASKTTAS
jgi:hypothetical protein